MFEIRIDGKKAAPNQIANELERAMVREVRQRVEASVRGLRCSVHGAPPRFTTRGEGPLGFSFELLRRTELAAPY